MSRQLLQAMAGLDLFAVQGVKLFAVLLYRVP
jgi:hypothetical protein